MITGQPDEKLDTVNMEIAQPESEQGQANEPGGDQGKARRIGKNAAALMVSLVALGVAQFAVLGLISRFGGPEDAGTWAYVSAFRDPFAVFMDFGTTRLLVAEIARRRSEADILLGNGVSLGFIIALPVMLALVIAANLPFFDNSELVIRGIYLMGIGAFLYTTMASFRSAFRAFNRFQYEAISSVLTSVVLVASTFVVLYFNWPFEGVFVAFALAQLVALIYFYYQYNRRLGHFRLGRDRNIMGQLLNKTWAFSLVGLLTRAFTRIDVIILTLMQGAAASGFYALATTVFYQLNTIAQLASTAILPTMARSYVKKPDQVGRQLDVAVRLQVLVGLPCTALGLVFADQIIRLLYGPGYDESAVIFQLLVSVVILRFVNQTLGVALTAMDRQNWRAISLTVTVVFNIVINVVLIQRWGVLGATVTAVLSEILLFITTYVTITPDTRHAIQWRQLIRPTLAVVATAPILYLIRDWPMIIGLPLGLTLMTILTFLFRSFSQVESAAIAKGIGSIRRIPAPARKQMSRIVLACARGPREPLAGES